MIALLFAACLLSVVTVEGWVHPCYMPILTGRCRARMPMYAFNPQLGACVEFVYGGCGGNYNRFETKEECEAICGGFRHQM
ncbi:hypothetical protein AAHC03_019376 [Spirometra sp. Aus1]|nr:unnamed protein product [Spirometra erinaceieuropaei]